ncbi:MAG: glycoside hydrolase family 2 TIM barrel-domain containing protein [Candidatus Hadarchaeales archaeon]
MQKNTCPLAIILASLVLSSVASGVVYYTYCETKFSAEIIEKTVVTVDGRRLLVNGSPFTVKGVCYSPTPPGEGPDFFWWHAQEIYENDFENIRSMGANTIRTYNAGVTYFNDAYYWVYHDDGIPLDSYLWTWQGGGGSFTETHEITPPEGTKSFKTVSANWAGWGIFLANPSAHTINLSGATALKFWVKTTANLKVEIEAPQGNTQTKYISNYGWDGTNNWQEITIPASHWSNLNQVYCPFKITMETSGTFYIDKVRWTGFSPYSDGGIPGGVKILTWGDGYFEARYTGFGPGNVPEGGRCFLTQPSGSYAGWGLFLALPHDHTVDLSGASALKFWVKTPVNLKIEIEAPKGNIQSYYISQFGWDGTNNWQEITIPAENWENLDKVYSPFMITVETNQTFYVDFVRWENFVPPPQHAILENRDILDAAWSQRLYVIMGYWVDRSVDMSKSWVRENLKEGFLKLVNKWKDHPAVLMWAFGNEVDVYPARKENWFSLVQAVAFAAKQVDDNHPVMTVNQDITRIGDPSIGSADENLTSLDIWGVNVYYGSSFGNLFSNYKVKSSKPLLLAEWGCDALDARDNTENQLMQKLYIENLWDEISENLSAENENRVCIGGTVFEWSDEWWKAGNYEIHDNLATWANPNYYDYVAGQNNMNEEWWGIMKLTSLESPVKIPRLAYYALKEKWT